MARYTYGGTIYDVAVNATTAGQPITLSADGTWPLYDAAGAAQTDFLLWNSSTSAYDIAATSISVTGGFVPKFQGPDATELYDGSGHRVPHFDGGTGTALTSYATQVASLGDYPATFPPSTHTHTASQVTDFTTATVTALGDPTAVTAIQQIIHDYLSTNSINESLMVGPNDALPGSATQGAILSILTSGVSGGLSASSYFTEAIAASGTSVTTSGTPTAIGSGAVVVAFVSSATSGATSGTPSVAASGFAGMGLTWTQVTLPTTTQFNGSNSVALFIGKGTGTNVKPTITFATAPTNVHLRMVKLTNANGTVVQAASAALAASQATPTVALPAAVSTGTITLTWIVQNNATNAQTPGTGYTELASALSSSAPNMRTSGAYALPSMQSAPWTTSVTPSGNQKIVTAVEVS